MPVALPPKKDVALALLQSSTVFIHLDPRHDDVIVPAWFKRQPQLVLQVGLNMAVPIPDLVVDDDCVACTLSFNRAPFYCRVPWSAVFALIAEDRRGMVWPDNVPREVAVQAQQQARESSAREQQAQEQQAKRSRFRVVGDGTEPAPEPAGPAESATASAAPAPRASRQRSPAHASRSRGRRTEAVDSESSTESSTESACGTVGGKAKQASVKRPARKTASQSTPKKAAAKPKRVAAPKARGEADASRQDSSRAKRGAAAKPESLAGRARPEAGRGASRKTHDQSGGDGSHRPADGKSTSSKRPLPPYLRVVK